MIEPVHLAADVEQLQQRLSAPLAKQQLAALRVLFDWLVVGLHDQALIALMVYTFAGVGAAISMRVEDVFVQGRRTWVRLHEKGGKEHEMPCHHNLDDCLHAYLDQALQGVDRKSFLFRSARGQAGILSDNPMSQADVYQMIGRRAEAASVATRIGCHSFRATGITEYLRNGGRWLTMRAQGRPGSTTGGRTRCRWMRWRGS